MVSHVPPAPSSQEPLLGRTLGDFVLQEKIGEGGFGSVFRAEQPVLERQAVIKILRSEVQVAPDGVQGFLREARLASQIDHPYATHIYSFGAEPDGLMWIAMELVRGTTLDSLLRTQGPLPLRRFIGLFDRLCEVIQTAHDRGIVHCDLKPANVMILSRSGKLLPKLLDLGIARVRAGAASAAASAMPAARQSASGLIGSPHYMAPEQWARPHLVNARTDIYALGVLVYEALVGKRLFDGPEPIDIARAHARQPLPELPKELPSSLHAVIARALAKKPAQRFESAMEFAAALREAAGVADEPEELPTLQEELRDTLLLAAPQPLADVIALLEAARDAAHLQQALGETLDLLAHYLGVLALACRVRIGPGGDADVPAVAEAFSKLRAGRLGAAAWLELARNLCRPFIGRADLYPIPELVHFLFQADGQPANHGDLLAGLVSGSTENAIAQRLTSLDRVLRGLQFLSEYRLGIPSGGFFELCMGARSRRRASVPLRDSGQREGEAMLVDSDGNLILTLAPFVQVLTPTPGAADEIFLFDGNGRHGAKLLARPAGFERHDPGLWKACAGLFGEAHQAALQSQDERSPYRGLATFGVDDAELFFGREREAEAFANRLRLQALIAVVGPSGAGKSSFIQAGVIPSLPGDWQTLITRPGTSPISTLVSRLAAEGLVDGSDTARVELRAAMMRNPAVLGDLLRRASRERGKRFLLLVDQFEELITLCADETERHAFAETLVQAAPSGDEAVRVVLTLRDDFLMRAQQLPVFQGRLAQGLELLGIPQKADLERILVEPARRRGYEFDDPTLPLRMVDSVAKQAGALALLSFAASKLWELRDRQFHRLTGRAYESLGGVGGALAQHAERTLAEMAPEEQRLVREAFRHLVTADGTRATLSRREMTQVLGGGQAAENALESLVHARLLIAQDAGDGETRVEVIHETLLSSWPRLVKWQREDAEGARMRDQVRAAARQWQERGRPKGMLWRGETLTEYRLWRARYQGTLTEIESAFAEASLRDETRGRRIRRALMVSAFITLTVGIVILVRANHLAQIRTAKLYQEQGRRAALEHDPMRALVYLQQAYREGARGAALDFLVARSLEMLRGQLAVLRHKESVNRVVFSPDGSQIATASDDKTAALWDGGTGKRLATFAHGEEVFDVVFSPDGKLLATASWDGAAKLWDAQSGKLLHSFSHKDRVWSVRFSNDGSRVLTASADGTAGVWDAKTGKPLLVLPHGGGKLNSAQFSPDDALIATAGRDKTAKLWDGKTGRLLATLTGHTDTVWSLAFSPDGRTLATVSWDGTARLWDVAERHLRYVLDARGVPLGAAADIWYERAVWSSDGKRLVVEAEDREAHVWDTQTGKLVFNLPGHKGYVLAVAISQDGKLIATTSRDGTIKIWNTHDGSLAWTLTGHLDEVNDAAFDPTGTRIATASLDGTARVWQTTLRQHVLSIDLSTPLDFAAFDHDGSRFATVTSDGRLGLWQTQGGRSIAKLPGETPHPLTGLQHTFVEFSPDSDRLLSSADEHATMWDLRTSKPVLRFDGHKKPIFAGVISPDGSRVVTGGYDPFANVWDAHTGHLVRSLEGHTDGISSVSFSPDGRRILTASYDKTARIWDAETGRTLLVLSHRLAVTAASFSKDGRRVITASNDKSARVWDASTGTLLVSLEGHSGALNYAAFHPQNPDLAVTGSTDNTWKVWDIQSGMPIASTTMDGAVASVDFSPDGKEILAASFDKTVKLWNAQAPAFNPAVLARYIECNVPFQVGKSGQLLAATPAGEGCGSVSLPIGASGSR